MKQEIREAAIIWWHDLAFDEREKYYDGYKKWTPAKDHTQLTGREIQNIWAVAMNPPEPKEDGVKEPVLNDFGYVLFKDKKPANKEVVNYWMGGEKTGTYDAEKEIIQELGRLPKFWKPISEINNCDGCMAGMPLEGIFHINESGKTHMICSKNMYKESESISQSKEKPESVEEAANEYLTKD